MLTVGEILRRQRESKNIQLTDVEKQIKIRAKFLQAVENNDWNFFSSKIYITGIIKNYANFLELDPKKMLAFFRRDYEKKEDMRFKRRIASAYLTPETKKVVIMVLTGIFLIFFAYFGFQIKSYLSPPSVVFMAPKADHFSTETSIDVIGKTDKDAMISIFGDRVFQNKDGIFEYNFPLHDGQNILTIDLVGANGKKAIVKKSFYKSSP